MCGWSACSCWCKTHDLHLGRCQASNNRQCVDVLHYDYVFVMS